MNRKLLLSLSIIPVFLIIYFLHSFLLDFFQVKNHDFAYNFYVFLTGIALLMLTSMLGVSFVQPKYTGFTFLAWSMIKIMLVMAYFVWFVLKPDVKLQNPVIYNIVTLYMLYLFYEVIFAVILLKENKV